eukprot:1034657-Prorocentrum_minimum.AAC.3
MSSSPGAHPDTSRLLPVREPHAEPVHVREQVRDHLWVQRQQRADPFKQGPPPLHRLGGATHAGPVRKLHSVRNQLKTNFDFGGVLASMGPDCAPSRVCLRLDNRGEFPDDRGEFSDDRGKFPDDRGNRTFRLNIEWTAREGVCR